MGLRASGPRGPTPTTLAIHAELAEGDPLHGLPVGQKAALLFLDFDTGRTLHLSGTAEVEWDAAGRPGDDGHTGRRVVFTLQRLVAGRLLPSRQVTHSPYPRNPALTD